ncbi:MAG TPA: type IV pilus modification protein PilV [Spongiibacteraceae bacterium]|nr:type IV pilus modification protein PilV [Spongiibacteraceae bacterium]
MPIINRRHQQGSSLIEVMIALLILAIGLLGFAGMQTRGLVTGRQAFLHSQAELLAEDMLERIRANKSQANLYTMGIADAGVDNGCDTKSCTAIELRQWDQRKWQSRLDSSLPGGVGEVLAIVGGNPYTTLKITVHYDLDKVSASDADKYKYVLSSQIYQ